MSKANIPPEECKDGYAYRIHARNGSVGIWNTARQSFTLARHKFGKVFLGEEFHWDTGAPHGTAAPKKEIGKPPEFEDDGDKLAWLQEMEKKEQDAKYNHAFTVAFTVENGFEDGYNTPFNQLIAGLSRRIANLMEEWRHNPEGVVEAFECYDTYEEE